MDGPIRAPATPGTDYRDLIHLLNQRYYRQWLRAERLHRQNERLGRWLKPALTLLRLLRRLVPARSSVAAPPAVRLLDELAGEVAARVSIIIPFRDRLELLRTCLRSLRTTAHRPVEVVLVDNGSSEPATRRYLRRLRRRGRVKLVAAPGPFNFSHLCNAGAAAASGDYLVFLNNDTEVLHADWLGRFLRVAARPDVGIVGATLLYPDHTVQHAGLHPLADGRWVHTYRGEPFTADRGPLSQLRVVEAVSGACLVVKATTLSALGGFDERLPLTYNDVDLCCRARQAGLLVAVTPHARLLHYEGLSRGFQDDQPGQAHLTALPAFPPAPAARR